MKKPQINLNDVFETGKLQAANLISALEYEDVKVALIKKGTKIYPALVSNDEKEIFCIFLDSEIESCKINQKLQASIKDCIDFHSSVIGDILAITDPNEQEIKLDNSDKDVELLLKYSLPNRSKDVN
jgi:hypothetical protein